MTRRFGSLTSGLATAGFLSLATGAMADTVTVNNWQRFASSILDWSASGTQGENNWSYGYYDQTNSPGVFVPFENSLHWNVNHWDHGFNGGTASTNAPWTDIGVDTGHPNTTAVPANPGVTGGPLFDAVRRYTVPNSVAPGTEIGINWLVRKANANGGGVTGRVLVNGVEVDASTIAGNANNAVLAPNRFVTAVVNPGDVVDLVLNPQGPTDPNDGSDGSYFSMDLVFNNAVTVNNATLIADSTADWSTTGMQGENGWSYGYFDVTTSPGHGVNDFIAFAPGQWDGTKWDRGANAPWTEVTQSGGHPNGTNNATEEWATRRYEVQPGEGGDLFVEWFFSKSNINAGGAEGVGLNILLNGEIVDSYNIFGRDGTGVTRGTLIPGAQPGDLIDIALTPVGPGGSGADGSDGSNFSARIFLIPEPNASLLVLAGAGLLGLGRRRRTNG